MLKGQMYTTCRTCRGTGEVTCAYPPDYYVAGVLECILCNSKGYRLEYIELPTEITGNQAQYIYVDEIS